MHHCWRDHCTFLESSVSTEKQWRYGFPWMIPKVENFSWNIYYKLYKSWYVTWWMWIRERGEGSSSSSLCLITTIEISSNKSKGRLWYLQYVKWSFFYFAIWIRNNVNVRSDNCNYLTHVYHMFTKDELHNVYMLLLLLLLTGTRNDGVG